MKIIRTQENIEIFIADYWDKSLVKTAKGFADSPMTSGIWNVTKGTARAIAGTFWNMVMTPIGAVMDLLVPGETTWGDAGTALKHTIGGIGDTVYGLAQMGYAGIKALKDFAAVAAREIRQSFAQSSSKSGQPVDPKIQQAVDKGADAVEDKILQYSDHVQQGMAA